MSLAVGNGRGVGIEMEWVRLHCDIPEPDGPFLQRVYVRGIVFF